MTLFWHTEKRNKKNNYRCGDSTNSGYCVTNNANVIPMIQAVAEILGVRPGGSGRETGLRVMNALVT